MTTTQTAGHDYVRDPRMHRRLVPRDVSELFTRCIRDAHDNPGSEPTAAELRTLTDWYGLPPRRMLRLIGDLADDRKLIARAASIAGIEVPA
jgi:pyridoxine/pyridoxamine 5'-phosphate oxidase